MIWYRAGQMECVWRHVTQEMPYFKTNLSHLRLLKLQSLCWSTNMHVALLTFSEVFSWSRKDGELV